MKKFNLKSGIWGFMAGAAVMGCIPAVAKDLTTSIDVIYKDIKIYADGVPVNTGDNNEPFISNGTTYLPVRAVGEAFNKNVTWNGATSTVYIGEVPGEKKDFMSQAVPYEFDGYYSDCGKNYMPDDEAYFTMSGKKYTSGFALERIYGYINDDGVPSGGSAALINLNSQYAALKVDIGHIDGTEVKDVRLYVYLDGKLSETIDIAADQGTKTYNIPLNYANQVKLLMVNSKSTLYSPSFGFANGLYY